MRRQHANAGVIEPGAYVCFDRTVHQSADQPLQAPGEDRLERLGLARALAGQLVADGQWTSGFVVGIGGRWGSGKTSLINLVVHYATADAPGLIVFRFNPWLFADADQLVTRFCLELALRL